MGFYDEVEVEDMVWDPVARVFHFPCPCGGASFLCWLGSQARDPTADGHSLSLAPPLRPPLPRLR